MRKKSRRAIHRREFMLDSNENLASRRRGVSKVSRLSSKFLGLKKITGLFQKSLLLGVFVTVVGGTGAFAVFSPYFKLKTITIESVSPYIHPEEVKTLLQDFYGKNLLFTSKQVFTRRLQEQFPEFQKISFSEKWPSQLVISIEVSAPALTVFNFESANFFVLSKEGIVLSEGASDGLPVVKIFQHTDPILVRERLLSAEIVEKIFYVESLWIDQTGLSVEAIQLLDAAREIHLISTGGVEIWFDLNRSIEEQMKALEDGEEKIGLYQKRLEHIDLRIPGRIFWKER